MARPWRWMMARPSFLHYRRDGNVLQLVLRLSPLETRDLAMALFARLQDDDRAETLQDMLLLHTEPDQYLNERASAVARAMVGRQVINIDTVSPMFHAELPRVR